MFSKNLQQLYGAANPQYAFGDQRRYSAIVRAPNYDNLDISLQKETRIPWRDKTSLVIQMDAFDALNHPIFAAPDGLANANFGKITGARGGPRVIQLSAHFMF